MDNCLFIRENQQLKVIISVHLILRKVEDWNSCYYKVLSIWSDFFLPLYFCDVTRRNIRNKIESRMSIFECLNYRCLRFGSRCSVSGFNTVRFASLYLASKVYLNVVIFRTLNFAGNLTASSFWYICFTVSLFRLRKVGSNLPYRRFQTSQRSTMWLI